MKRAVLLVLSLLLINPVSAIVLDLGAYSVENPRFTIAYTKEVSLRSMSLISLEPDNPTTYTLAQTQPVPSADLQFAREYILLTQEQTQEGVQPIGLVPGRYQLTLEALDRQGHRTLDIAEFVVEGLMIEMLEPPLGIAKGTPYDVYFLTRLESNSTPARCKYSGVGFGNMQQISGDFSTEHLIKDLDYKGYLYITCEEQSGRQTSKRFTVGWDSDEPGMSVSADPELVKNPLRKYSILTVATDEPTYCELEGEPFADGVRSERESYRTEHEQQVFYNDITDKQEHAFEHEIVCYDVAQNDVSETVNVTVNFGLAEDIVVLEPGRYVNTGDFRFSLQTTFQSQECLIDDNPMDRTGDIYSLNYDGVEDGTYGFLIKCIGEKTTERQYNVTVDTRGPSVEINASQLLCEGNVSAIINAQDTQGVLGYHYEVRDDQGIIREGDTIKSRISAPLSRSLFGNLVWSVEAEDRAGNIGAASVSVQRLRQGQDEECGLPPFIRLEQPNRGFAFTEPYDVVLATSRPAECRYSLQPGVDWSARASFSSSEGLRHSQEFSFTNQDLHVWCVEPEGVNHTKTFTVGVDTTAPKVSVSARPNPLIDPTQKIAVLSVTTDDKTFCTYNGMPFDGSEQDASGYAAEHAVALDFRNVTSTQPEEKEYLIVCKNLANLQTEKTYTIHMNLGAELAVDRISPEEFTSEEFITLSVRPNIEASCQWRSVSDSILEDFDATDNNTHSVSLGNLDEGTHQYVVECLSATKQGTSLVEFTVDRSAPSIESVSGPDVVCDSARYYYNITGVDQGVTVRYGLDGPAGAEFERNTTEPFILLDNSGLPEGQYTLSIQAVSRGGLESAEVQKQVEFRADCDPALCENGQRDSGEAGVDCGGFCSAQCTGCVLDTECDITQSCEAGQCVALPDSGGNGSDDDPDDEQDNQTGSADPPDLGGSSCTSDFQCSLDEECRNGECVPVPTSTTVPPDPGDAEESSGADWMALVMLILGVLVMGGAGYYLYEQHLGKGLSGGTSYVGGMQELEPPRQQPGQPSHQLPDLPQQPQSPQQRTQNVQPQQDTAQQDMERERLLEEAKENREEKLRKRKEVFKAFEDEEDE